MRRATRAGVICNEAISYAFLVLKQTLHIIFDKQNRVGGVVCVPGMKFLGTLGLSSNEISTYCAHPEQLGTFPKMALDSKQILVKLFRVAKKR